MKSILVNGHTYYEGDHVLAELVKTEEPTQCDDLHEWYYGTDDDENDHNIYTRIKGILNIQSDNVCYICQNALSGEDAAENHHGKRFSWRVTVRDGRIISSDTRWINPVIKTPTFIVEEVSQTVEIDEDPMPDDWQLPYPIPEHL